ncbi:MAG: response regulator transcription factor [Erysipelotrichia bacterium]|nr:response regulator transcription factor [Erysipelotrichia bacterium]
MSTLLVVDDEVMIREVIKEYGNLYNYRVLQAQDGLEALEILQKNEVDCVILDIMLPDMDGFMTCKKIKETADIPVIMLSARVSEEDKLLGFDLGIDDYVEKPFSPKVLMARVKVVIDRNLNNSAVADTIREEGIEIDNIGHSLKIDGQEVHVTNKEFELLLYFLKNPNIAISRDTLLEKIWGNDFYGFDRTIDTHIKMLRKNLGKYGDKIVTVRGVGYKFEK